MKEAGSGSGILSTAATRGTTLFTSVGDKTGCKSVAMATRLKRRSSLQHHPRLGGGAHAHAHAHAHDGAGSSNESFDDPPDDIAPAEEERERRARRGLQKRQSMGHVGHSVGRRRNGLL